MFKLYDRVTWTSQSRGTTTSKTGMIVEVLPPGDRPDEDRFPRLYRGAGCGMSRRHESYVVRTDEGKIYWPVVSKLTALTYENVARAIAEPPMLDEKDRDLVYSEIGTLK